MDIENVLIVFFLFVLFPAVLMNGIRKIKASKAARLPSGGELRASDLRAIVREAVEEAIAPLSARVADVEERMGDESVESLRARLDPALLSDLVETDLTETHGEAAGAVRRRTR